MRRSLNIKLVIVFSLVFGCQLKAQNDSLTKLASATKIFTAGYFFPSPTPTFSYPSPVIGISGSLFVGMVELELGAMYYPKFDRTRGPNIGTSYDPVYAEYPSISYTQDYLSFYFLTNVKMGQVKKHHFSVDIGLLFRKNLSWSSDTLKSNDVHQGNDNIQTLADRTIAFSMIGGFRYTYHFNPKLNFVTGLDIGSTLNGEYHINGVFVPAQSIDYQRPIEPVFTVGLSLAMQFMISKKESVFYSDKRFN